jgi:hypothetical protein
MAKFKLVIENGDTFLTGAELESLLRGMNFTVPQKVEWVNTPVPRLVYPPRPKNGTWQEWDIWLAQAGAIANVRNSIIAANKANTDAFLAQYPEYATVLEGLFHIATEVFTGEHTATGQKVWEYRIVPNPAYSFLQCAQMLIGYTTGRPADPINFICFGNFG